MPWHSRCDWGPVARRVAAQFTENAAAPQNRTGCRCAGQGGSHDAARNRQEVRANQEDGQDLLEYALLVALIALIAIGAVGLAGGAVNTIFSNIANALTAAA